MKNSYRHAVALVSMLGGSLAVFGLIYAMNAEKPAPVVEKVGAVVDFQVAKKVRKKKRQSRPKRRRQQVARSAPKAPLPNLTASLSQASFALRSYSGTDLTKVNQSLLGDTSKKLAMTEGTLDEVPKPIRRVGASFPPSARKRGIEGYVKMSVFINDQGSVESVRVLDADPRGVFDEVAEQAIRDWEFQPGVYQGQAVPAWITQTFRFQLKKTT